MSKRGLAAACAVALTAALPAAADATHRPNHKPGGGTDPLAPTTFTAPYSFALGYGGCSGAPPEGVCDWTGVGTAATGLLGGSSSWDSGTESIAGNAYGGGYVYQPYTLGSGAKTITTTATFVVDQAMSATGSATGFAQMDAILELRPPGCTQQSCELQHREPIVDDYTLEEPPATRAAGEQFTVTATFPAPAGGTFGKGTARLYTTLVSFAGSSEGPLGDWALATGEVSGTAKLTRLEVVPGT
jgi:hypothetical protein